MVVFADQREDQVVVHPDHQDREEAGDEREVARPEHRERGPEAVGGDQLVARYLDLDHEQRHGDAEDAVAERFDACGAGILQRRRTAASSRAFRYMSAGRASRPWIQPDKISTETPSFLASGASPPQSWRAPARARIWGEGLAMGAIFARRLALFCAISYVAADREAQTGGKGAGERVCANARSC